MKNKVLPFNLLVLFASVLLLSFTYTDEDGDWKSQKKDSQNEAQYLVKIRNNQHTGQIDQADLIRVQQQIAQHAPALKSTEATDWISLGPDNFSGRVRTFIFDNQDASNKTLIAAGVSGGLWKTTTTGITWNKINGNDNLFVTCLDQSTSGTIYAGTGEAFNAEDYSVFGKYGYENGLMGSGLYVSTDGSSFEQIASTNPSTAGEGWGYFNDVVFDDNSNRLYVATQAGLFYSNDEGATWQTPLYAVDSSFLTLNATVTIQADSFEVQGGQVVYYGETITTDYDTVNVSNIRTTYPLEGPAATLELSSDGALATVVDGNAFIYKGGDLVFEMEAGYPDNPNYIVKDSIRYTYNVTTQFSGDTTFTATEVNDYEPASGDLTTNLPNTDADVFVGKIQYAFAPSNPDMLYASAINFSGELINLYLSEDKGNTWRVVLPGDNSLIDVYDGFGIYSSALAVHPQQADRIFIGSQAIFEGKSFNATGYYQWEQRSSEFAPPFSPLYLHGGQHQILFDPTQPNILFIATNGGVFRGEPADLGIYEFQPLRKGFTTTQFHTVAVPPFKHESMGGSQENATIYISGQGGNYKSGVQLRPQNIGINPNSNGGYCAFSAINSEVIFFSTTSGADRFYRSEDRGGFISTRDFIGNISVSDNDFLVPMKLWESFNDEVTRDSVYYYPKENHAAGETVQVISKNNNFPFYVTLEEGLSAGDSLRVQDKVQSKLFIGAPNNIWMALNSLRFDEDLNWFLIANNNQTGFTGNPSAMGLSADANQVYIGTLNGKLFRISNIRRAYNYETADCRSEGCIISTVEIPLMINGTQNTQAITSISVNPKNNQEVIVTLGNYGNENYVLHSSNTLDSVPSFVSIQGDPNNGGLPQMPVYSSLIEMESELIMVGTEHGIFTTGMAAGENTTWTFDSENMNDVPVMMMQQQHLRKIADSVAYFDGVETQYEVYPGTNNYGVIYAASYGRGLFRSDTYQQPVGIEDQHVNGQASDYDMSVYPNPANDQIAVEVNLDSEATVELNVYDLTGRKVLNTGKLELTSGVNTIPVSISGLSEGTYILQLTSGKKSVSRKLMVVE